MTLWRLHIRPDSTRRTDAVKFCLQYHIIGIGWQVSPAPSTKDEYFESGRIIYGNDNGWRKATTALLRSIQPNDLVWFRDYSGIYYIARVLSDWKYRDDAESLDIDVVNTRSVRYFKFGTRVPGKIESCFAPRATIQRILSEDMLLFSQIAFNTLAGQEVYPEAKKKLPRDLFQLLTATELEDVVGIYLQVTHGYVMIPSSRSRRNNTIACEYELTSPANFKRALVQVKSGDVVLDIEEYNRTENNWILFTTGSYVGKSSDRVCIVERKDLEIFIKTHRDLMPESIQYWLAFLDSVNN